MRCHKCCYDTPAGYGFCEVCGYTESKPDPDETRENLVIGIVMCLVLLVVTTGAVFVLYHFMA